MKLLVTGVDGYIGVLLAPSLLERGYNVGSNKENYQVKEIAQTVAHIFPDCQLALGASNGDNRSYRVSFDKIHAELPGFRCQRHALRGVDELYELFKGIKMTREAF
jgi:nucleoside-diphosphate-sugar epimerase